MDQVITALEALDPTPGRLQPVALANGAILLLDDFKGAQETIEAALEVLAQIPANRHIAWVPLALMGRQVRCEPTFCDVKVQL